MYSVEINYKYDDQAQIKRWGDFYSEIEMTWLHQGAASAVASQAHEVFAIDLYRIKDADLYSDEGPAKLQKWQQQALEYLLALSFLPPQDWATGSGKGITFTVNYQGENALGGEFPKDSFTFVMHSDTLIPNNYAYLTGWNEDNGEDGQWFVNKIAKQTGQLMALDPDMILQNPAIEAMIGQNYSLAAFNKAYAEEIANIILAIAMEKTADSNTYQYSITLTDDQWGMVTPSRHWLDSSDVWSLGRTRTLTSKTIKAEDLKEGGTGLGKLEYLRNTVVNDLSAPDITLIRGIGGTGKESGGVGHAKTEQDAFAAQLKEMAGQIRGKSISEYKLLESKATYSHWLDWGTAWDLTTGGAGTFYDWLTDADPDQNTLKVIMEQVYSSFLRDVMSIEKSNDQDKYTPIREAWKRWSDPETETGAANQILYKLVDIILTDKEISRRVAKWNFLADLDRDKYRTSGGSIVDKETGQIADDVYKQMGQVQAGAFASGDVPEATGKLTKEEVENRKKFYKQCALMLNAHTLKDQLETRWSLQRSIEKAARTQNPVGSQTTYPFDGRFWMAKCDKDQERLIGNLISSKPAAVFFDIPPALMTYLTPKIRLFRVSNPQGGQTKEVEFVFPHTSDINRTQNYTKPQTQFLNADFDKGSGCGLKEFSFEFNGTNPAEARNDITATLTLFFQSFNDFIRERVSDTGDTYRFVDLVIQPKPDQEGNKVNGVEIVHPNQYDPSFFRIRAEVGYYMPDSQVPFKGQSRQSLKDAITATNKSFFLCMVDHTINVNEDGTVTIEISYRAYVETALKSLRFDAISTPELIKKRHNMQKGLIELLTSGQCTEQQIKDYKAAQSGVEDELRRRSLQSIIARLLDRGYIYILKIPPGAKDHFLTRGYFQKRPEPVSVHNVAPPVDGETPQQVLENSGDTSTLIPDLLSTELPDLADYDYTDMADTTIQFFFFGDLLHTISDIIYEENNPLSPIIGMENNKYILGSFDFDAFIGDGEKGVVLNTAQIPISVDFFSQWFTDQVLTKGETRKSFPIISFIRNLCNNVLQSSLLESCLNRKIKKALRFSTGQITAYSESGEDPMAILCQNSPNGIIDTSTAGTGLPLKGDSEDSTKKDKIKNFYNYITLNVLGSSLTYAGKGDYGEDIEDGRFHMNIGSNRGIVKTISFEKADIQYIREARFFQQGIDGLLQLSAVYNASIEMFGNTLFYPGMEVFINPFGIGGTEFGSPTKGPTSEGGRSMANILGIGGYHTITNVATSLTPERFSTTIKALQYYSGDGQGNPNLEGQIPDDSEVHSISEQEQETQEGAQQFCVGRINDVINILDQASVENVFNEIGPLTDTAETASGGSLTNSGTSPGTVINDPSLPVSTFVFRYSMTGATMNGAINKDGVITLNYDRVSGIAGDREFFLNNVKQATLKWVYKADNESFCYLDYTGTEGEHTNYYSFELKEPPSTEDLLSPPGTWSDSPDDIFLEEEGFDVIPPKEPDPPPPAEPGAGSVDESVLEEEVFNEIQLTYRGGFDGEIGGWNTIYDIGMNFLVDEDGGVGTGYDFAGVDMKMGNSLQVKFWPEPPVDGNYKWFNLAGISTVKGEDRQGGLNKLLDEFIRELQHGAGKDFWEAFNKLYGPNMRLERNNINYGEDDFFETMDHNGNTVTIMAFQFGIDPLT